MKKGEVQMYKFSVPLRLDFDIIDKLAELNDSLTKSKIISLYNCLPANAEGLTGFEQTRTKMPDVNSFEDMAKYISYAINKGFDFVYLLNSPRPFSLDKDNLKKQKENLNTLLKQLLEVNCTKIRITNTQLIDYVYEKFPEFNICCSTSQEYTQLKQYKNLLQCFPGIKNIVPSWDMNKNFPFLLNFKKAFPDVEIELMLNEGCIAGCPFRIHHHLLFSSKSTFENFNEDQSECFNAVMKNCTSIYNNNFWETICLSNVIYPWDIPVYAKLGFNNFKLVGRCLKEDNNDYFYKFCQMYLMGLEDNSIYDNVLFKNFNYYIYRNPAIRFKASEIRPYLPDINHFVKNGAKCASECGVKCRYCYNLAKKLNDKFPGDFKLRKMDS